MKLCPCQSNKRYLDCCGLYIEKKFRPPSPEALMRSRYTAFVEGKLNYIQKTMKPPASLNFNKKQAKKDKTTIWLGLNIIEASFDPNNSSIGFVEFKAKFRFNQTLSYLHERSEFHLIDNHWYYVDGQHFQDSN